MLDKNSCYLCVYVINFKCYNNNVSNVMTQTKTSLSEEIKAFVSLIACELKYLMKSFDQVFIVLSTALYHASQRIREPFLKVFM